MILPLCCLIGIAACNGEPVRLYVAPHGDDAADGSYQRPLATLNGARDVLRAHKQACNGTLPGGAVVTVQGELTTDGPTLLSLDARDSGAPGAPIIYQAAPGQRARLRGGKTIYGWERTRNPRVDASIRNHVIEIDLSQQEVTNYGTLAARGFGRPPAPSALQLYWRGAPLPLAGWPNDGWTTIADVPGAATEGRLVYSDLRPRRWKHIEDVWLHGYWTWDWADSYERIAAIDQHRKLIATFPPHGVYGYKTGARYRILNVLEELDAPGEWYLDRAEGLLYVWPPQPHDWHAMAVTLAEQPLVALNQASDIVLRGLTLELCRAEAIVAVDCDRLTLDSCVVRSIGTRAAVIRGGRDARVLNCDFEHADEGGLSIAGGDRMTLQPAGHPVDNCRFRRTNHAVRTYRPAVLIEGVGIAVTRCQMEDLPHSAVIIHGNEHTVECNEIRNVCLETQDAGAIYLGRDFTQRGNRIRYNLIRDLGPGDTRAIYLDDWTSGTDVTGNLLINAGMGVCIGGGRDNRIDNNVFIRCRPAVHIDARGKSWAKNYFDGTTTTLTERMDAVNARQPPYSERYPELATLYDDDPAWPKNNRITHNIRVGGQWVQLRDGVDEATVLFAHNLVEGDPGFVAAEQEDYRLRPDGAAAQLGIQSLPVELMGLRREIPRPDGETF